MISLQSLRDYFSSLTWVENGLMTRDVLLVLDFLETSPDSRWLVAESKRCVVLLRHWREAALYRVRQIDVHLKRMYGSLEGSVRQSLVEQGRTIRQRSVTAGIFSDPEYLRLTDSRDQYERVIGTLEGLSDALDSQLLVQEAVAVRRQEEADNQLP